MGMSKGLMEKVMVGRSRNLNDKDTIITERDMEMLWHQEVL